MTLHGKVAIVTGGNSGIGKGIVLALAEAGANIVIDYVSNPQATEELEQQVAPLGDQAIGVDADVSKVAELQRLVDTAVSTFGRVDIMVNNAGIETRTSVLDTTEQQYDRVLDINLKSAFFGTQIAARQMIKQGGGGRIINITSVHEDWPMPDNTAVLPVQGRHADADADRRRRVGAARRARRRRRPRRRGHADQRLDRGGPGQAGEAQHAPSPSAAWRSRRRSDPWSPSWPATALATSPPRRSSPTAGSCSRAPAWQ